MTPMSDPAKITIPSTEAKIEPPLDPVIQRWIAEVARPRGLQDRGDPFYNAAGGQLECYFGHGDCQYGSYVSPRLTLIRAGDREAPDPQGDVIVGYVVWLERRRLLEMARELRRWLRRERWRRIKRWLARRFRFRGSGRGAR